MKRTLVVLIAVAGAVTLLFVGAANLFPDWTWRVLTTARSVQNGLLGEKKRVVDLSKYSPPLRGSAEIEQVSCLSLPEGSFYSIGVALPRDESCSPRIGDLSLNNYGMVGNPLRGWVGCIDGHDIEGLRIEALSRDGKNHLTSTVTNSKGRFVFPNLKSGTYDLVVNSRGLQRIEAIVTTNPRSQHALCLVVAGTTRR